MADGIYWFTDPGVIAQKFSLAKDQLGDDADQIVDDVTERGAETMRQIVLIGGVKNKEPTGGPRARTWAMFDSIDAKAGTNARGRSQGEFGYIDRAPGWTPYQELGTSFGIIPLHALATAMNEVEWELQDEAGKSLERVWANIWGG